jgi:hypothetical protein
MDFQQSNPALDRPAGVEAVIIAVIIKEKKSP